MKTNMGDPHRNLVDFQPDPSRALVDGPQALLLSELPHFLADVALARETYERRVVRARESARA
jgi:3-deoxy-7-phosphoheptulonate synthase